MTANAKVVFPVLLVAGFILAGTSGLVRLGAADQGTQPLEQTSRRAYDLLAEGFGAGFNGPIPIVVDVNGDKQAPQRIYDGVQGLEDVASVARAAVQRREHRRDRLRHPEVGAAGRGDGQARRPAARRRRAGGDLRRRARVAYVSGQTAAFKDIADQIISRMPIFLLFIIGVTFIVLAMAFRSIVVSATAAVTTLLSAFIGFGVLGLVVQQGHLLGLTGLDKTGPIETFVPPIAFAILFGLSMDYMVFIMSRIREEHVHGLDTRAAVEHGISAIGRVVVAAALIMGTVFAAFILSADRVPKEFGLLLAIAILTDALIVRMTLVPAFLTLMGEKSWYMPRWLDRVLPNITIEPPHDGESAHSRRGAGARAGRRSLSPEARRHDLNGRQPAGMRESPRMRASTRISLLARRRRRRIRPRARGSRRPGERGGARAEVRPRRPARRPARGVRAGRAVHPDRRGRPLRRTDRRVPRAVESHRPRQDRAGGNRSRQPLRAPPRLPGRPARCRLRLRALGPPPHGRTKPAVYAHVATDPGYPGKLALQYWFFYPFNDFNNTHEGDWEMTQLVFDAATRRRR